MNKLVLKKQEVAERRGWPCTPPGIRDCCEQNNKRGSQKSTKNKQTGFFGFRAREIPAPALPGTEPPIPIPTPVAGDRGPTPTAVPDLPGIGGPTEYH